LDDGDGYDAHHGLITANFDEIVCRGENARKYATPGCRNGQNVIMLDQFIASLDKNGASTAQNGGRKTTGV